MRTAAVLLTSAFLMAASAAPGHLPDHERRTIAELAQHYLQHRANKVTNAAQINGFGIQATEPLATELRTDEAELEARRTRLSSLGGYSHAEVQTSLHRITVAEDGKVVAHVRELTALYFEEPSTVTHTSYSMTHVLIFSRTATGWALQAATTPPGTKCGMPPETQFCRHER